MDFLKEPHYVIFDIETSGNNCGMDEILEIAGQKFQNHKLVEEFQCLIKPEKPVSAEMTAIHGITNELLSKEGKPMAEVLPAFMQFVGAMPVMGHNIAFFDVPFVNAHLMKLQKPVLTNKIIDTLPIARKALKLPSYSLKNLSAHYKVSYDGAHRAMADVKITKQVFDRLRQEFNKTLF